MDEEGYDIGASVAWGNAKPPPDKEAVSAVLEKEKLVKDIMSLQEGLRGLVERVDDVAHDCERKKADNAMLQTYINNLTRQNMMSAGNK